jgi:hypothetical protein
MAAEVRVATAETNILKEVMMALSGAGCIVWRNNVGALQDADGRWIRYGVCNPGGSDIIGIAPGGRFIALEVKTETGRVSKEQRNFIDAVLRAGGVAGVVRSAEDALGLVSQTNTAQ